MPKERNTDAGRDRLTPCQRKKNNMKILFFDTETTGVPKNYKGPMTDLQNWPRVIQLAWEVADVEKREVSVSEKHLIKPDGWRIPVEKFWIDNGFNQATNIEKGKNMDLVLDCFIESLNECDAIVAHNFAFDYPIIGAEMLRYTKRPVKKDRQKICTMETTVQLCKIPFGKDRRPWVSGGNYKWPKLEELYKFLFKKTFEGGHDAGNDVAGCRHCFFELVDRGVIKIVEPQP